MPLVQTRGAASAQGFGFAGKTEAAVYIEDVFSTYLYTGNGSAQDITTNIDTFSYGGLVWIKDRTAARNNVLYSTALEITRNADGIIPYTLVSNTTAAKSSDNAVGLKTTGFKLRLGELPSNNTSELYASWTFRKQPKFFDAVTYTGNATDRTIAHSLGSVPGMIIVKDTGTTASWSVYHRSLANTDNLVLNQTGASATNPTYWNSTTATSAVFSLGTSVATNASGNSFIAYLFAHDAGGFGLAGTDNVISCGIYTGNGSATGPIVTLGYEPQWLMIKKASDTSNWQMLDIMRGMPNGSSDATLQANLTNAETSVEYVSPTSTGFQITSTDTQVNTSAATYIYIAIRRGPMKVPTSGTSVFGLSARAGTGANATVTGGQTDDAVLVKNRGSAEESLFSSRLTGTGYLVTSTTAAEVAAGTTILQANPWDVMDGVKVGTTSTITNASANTYVNYLFKRAPNFFDVCAYTGTGASTTISHNLQAVPEWIIVKKRSGGLVRGWFLYVASLTSSYYIQLNLTGAATNSGTFPWNSTTPTSSVFSVTSDDEVNGSANTYVAYLFATLTGVSKVGTYTGNGSTQTIDCGLTAGARFVLLKRTDSTGNWYVYDTARGMTVLTDPYWLTNTTAAEVATLGSVTTVATGFALNSSVLAAINTSSATYIFLAIA